MGILHDMDQKERNLFVKLLKICEKELAAINPFLLKIETYLSRYSEEKLATASLVIKAGTFSNCTIKNFCETVFQMERLTKLKLIALPPAILFL